LVDYSTSLKKNITNNGQKWAKNTQLTVNMLLTLRYNFYVF